ncbi:MAG: CbtA family protein [Rhodobacteraceae bacterium]|nr:CbtA family protein [Paracoccaceae bacterium]
MIQRMLAGGLIAGFAAGLLAAVLHFAFLQKLILLGEQYETGALVHFENAHADTSAEGHDHGAEGHAHGEPASGATRNALTVLFTALTYASYGLLLAAGFAFAEHLGHRIDPREGLLWGAAGFAVFQLLPSLGLPPELPGAVAADITERQIWYFGTVAASGIGLALIAYGGGIPAAVIGAALLAAPHLVGAPHLDEYAGTVPPELEGQFVARALGVGFITWAVLGALAGRLWSRGEA